MIGWLAGDIPVVVTAAAAAQYLRVIDLEDRYPVGFAVTVLALGRRPYVLDWRWCGLHQAGLAMAGDTLTRRTLEYARDMAAFAIRAPMRAIEGPAGREMVKRRTIGRLGLRRLHQQSGRQRRGQCETCKTRGKAKRR